jgi:hypothetical protein
LDFRDRFEAFVSASQNHVSRLRRPALAETDLNAASMGGKAEHLALLRPLSRQVCETGKPAIDSSFNQIGGRQSEKAFRRMKLDVGEFFFLQAGVTFADKVFARFKLGNFNIRILPWLIQQP